MTPAEMVESHPIARDVHVVTVGGHLAILIDYILIPVDLKDSPTLTGYMYLFTQISRGLVKRNREVFSFFFTTHYPDRGVST